MKSAIVAVAVTLILGTSLAVAAEGTGTSRSGTEDSTGAKDAGAGSTPGASGAGHPEPTR